MTNDRYAMPTRLRQAGVAYVAASVILVTVAGRSVEGQRSYVHAMLLTGLLYTVPIVALATAASRRAAAGDRTVWRIWAVAVTFGAASTWLLYARNRDGWSDTATWSPVSTIVAIAILLSANTLILRRRSGERDAVVDAVDLLMATVAVAVPLALVWGDAIVGAPESWFTVTAAIWCVGSFHGLFVALAIRSRLRPGDRTNASIGIVLGAVGVVSSVVQIRHALTGFTAPSGIPLGTHAALLGLVLLFFLFSATTPSTGLERLPAAAQVRRRSAVLAGVVLAVPVIALATWSRRTDDWALATGLAALAALLLLSALRHLLSARETARLYREVERAATERGELLAEVMAHVDADRHRVAAHLHRQAVSLYTTVATMSCHLDTAAETGAPASGIRAVGRLRDDLGRRADSLRRVALAVKPLSPLDGPSQGLAATIRAYVENLHSDGPRPTLTVEVDPALVLDWTTEAIVVRILQEATNNVWRHADADALLVAVRAEDRALVVEVADDGRGHDDLPIDGRGIATMRSMAGFLGGELQLVSAVGRGTRVLAVLPIDGRPEPHRAPVLSIVR